MIARTIVHIDEEKCDGCGLCVPSCEEGAIRIVDGKARLVGDILCDGLGACLGHCPRGAISMIEREAAPYDEAAVQQHLAGNGVAASLLTTSSSAGPRNGTALPIMEAGLGDRGNMPQGPHNGGGCPGAVAKQLQPKPPSRETQSPDVSDPSSDAPSQLGNWPLKWQLIPPHAPYLREADLLLAADCTAAAYASFHQRMLRGRPVMIGCPKLDDAPAFAAKLVTVIEQGGIRSITVLRMVVPCCAGLTHLARTAVATSGQEVPLREAVISIEGELLGDMPAA